MEDWVKILLSALAGFTASTLLEPIRLSMGQWSRRRTFRKILYSELAVYLNAARSILEFNESAQKAKVQCPELVETFTQTFIKTMKLYRHDQQQVFDYYIQMSPDTFYNLPEWRVFHWLFMLGKGMMSQRELSRVVEEANNFIEAIDEASKVHGSKFYGKLVKRIAAQVKPNSEVKINSVGDLEKQILKLKWPPSRIRD
jgi:hypothetical protein